MRTDATLVPNRGVLLVTLCAALGLAALAGCGDDKKNPVIPPETPADICGGLVVVTSDYQTGSIALVAADSSFASHPDLTSIYSDAVARIHEGLVYVVNRFGGDNIQVLDPNDGFRTLRQFSVGTQTNPHDIALVEPGRAYVSRNGSTSLLKIDPRDGQTLGEISLASFADADGIPDMDRLFFRDPYLYVAVERIDFGGQTYLPVPPSYLAVIDTRADALVDMDAAQEGIQGIVLQGLNPSAPMVLDPTGAYLLVPESGAYGVLDGGIERIDLATQRSAGFLTREENLGGDLIDFVLPATGPGYATVSDASFKTALVSFDRATGVKIATIYQSDGYELADLIATPCGYLVVCDRDYESPGLRIFTAETGLPYQGVAQPVSTGLPPFELSLLGEE